MSELLLNSLAKLEKKEDAELIRAFVKVLEAQGLSKRRVLKYVSHLKLVLFYSQIITPPSPAYQRMIDR